MNVLCIAPHPDDEVLGCGGALCLHAQQGDLAFVVFLTSGELGLPHLPEKEARRIREAEASAAAKVLASQGPFFLRLPDGSLGEHVHAAADQLRPILKRFNPHLVYLPHPHEWHPDHKAAGAILQICLQTFDRAISLRAYEVWTPIQEYHEVLDVTPVWDRKISALRAHASQLAQWPYERAITGLNQYRGAMAGRCAYAEIFKSVQN